jgi:hypothetical protein
MGSSGLRFVPSLASESMLSLQSGLFLQLQG